MKIKTCLEIVKSAKNFIKKILPNYTGIQTEQIILIYEYFEAIEDALRKKEADND